MEKALLKQLYQLPKNTPLRVHGNFGSISGDLEKGNLVSLDLARKTLTLYNTVYSSNRTINTENIRYITYTLNGKSYPLVPDRPSYLNTGIAEHNDGDLQTGEFNAYLPISNLIGNNGMGPSLALNYYYSVGVEFTLGGWAPRFSYVTIYDTVVKLHLHTGQTFTIFESMVPYSPQPGLTIKDFSTPSQMKIVHKDGTVEILEDIFVKNINSDTVFQPEISAYAGNVDRCLVPTQIINSAGHALYFEWTGTLYANLLLSKISDDTQVLLNTSRLTKKTLLANQTVSLDAVEFIERPNQAPVTLCTLYLQDSKLIKYEKNNGPDADTQEFTYTGQHLTTIQHSRPLKELVTYSTDNRVSRYTVTGNNASSSRVEDYTFTASTAKRVTTFDNTSLTTELFFDADDLLTKTSVMQGDCIKSTEYKREFDSTAGLLLLHTLTTYKNKQSQRTETQCSVFDVLGNLVKRTANDVTTEFTYYRGQAKEEEMVTNTSTYTDTSGLHGKLGWMLDYMNPIGWGFLMFGKQGMTWGTIEHRSVVHNPYPTNTGMTSYNLPLRIECPGDPNYFRVYVESEKSYRTINGKRLDLRWTFYGYTSLPVKGQRASGPAVRPSVKLIIHNPQSDDTLKLREWSNSRMVVQETDYYTDPGDLSFGRIRSLTQRLLDASGKTIPLSLQKTSYTYQLQGDALTTTTTFQSSENTQDVTQATHSMRSYQLVHSQDPHGNSVSYSYDARGRMLTKSEQPQDKSAPHKTGYAYSLTQGCPTVITTFPTGQQYRECYDAFGRIASTETRASSDTSLGWRQLSSTVYDGLGREKTTLEYDYATAASETSPITKRQLEHIYDNWGNPTGLQVQGGIARHNEYDPVTQTRTVRQQYLSTACCKQITQYNSLGGIDKHSFVDAAGTVCQTVQYGYDAAGRISTQRGINALEQTYAWDSFGRLQKSCGDAVEHTCEYPDHTTSSLASRIKLDRLSDAYAYEWGSRKIDGLDRVVEVRAGGRARTYTYTGSNTWGTLSSAPAPSVNLSQRVSTQLAYDSSTSTLTQTTTGYPAQTTKSAYTYSLRGVLLKYTDDFGNQTTFTYDLLGRLTGTSGTWGSTALSYDSDERLIKESVTESAGKVCMTITYKYDNQSREIERVFTASGYPNLTARQSFDANNRLAVITLLRDSTELSQERFSYTPGGQLAVYECSGSQRPLDAQGKKLSKQTFSYNPLGGIQQCISVFDGGQDTATFNYDAKDKTQLRSISHSAAGRSTVTLDYDTDGRLRNNESGYSLSYNAAGRLARLVRSDANFREYSYLYDEQGKVMACFGTYYYERYYYRNGQQYARDGVVQINGSYYSRLSRFANQSDACQLLQQTLTLADTSGSGKPSYSFELKNAMGSVIASYDLATKAQTLFSYTPFGYRPDDWTQRSWLGFNGEPIDRPTGAYHLGNGARVYNSALQTFQTPDSFSPFGIGGLNGYVYCSNDPVNFSDPDGHAEVVRQYSEVSHGAFVEDTIVRASMDLVFGAALSVATGGISTGFGVATLGLEIVSGSFGVAAAALAERDPHTANILSWASFGTSTTGNIFDVADMIKVGRYATGSLSGIAISAERRATAALTKTFDAADHLVTMGGTMRSLTQIDGELYTFVDTYKAKDRLNIAVHGKDLNFIEEKLLNNSSSVILNNAEHSAADVLRMLNDQNVDPTLYDNIRLLICFSGNGGASSFAAQFKNLVHRPTKGFIGPVTMNYGSTPMAKIFSHAAQSGGAGTAELAAVFSQSIEHRVLKKNPYNLLEKPLLYAGFRYKPVKF
ncbi:RHS repeat-associated core domain-containing protein [Pseudomonas sp. R1-18]|uniref:RHS repeat domain-containing protein n=1 Tax=Pseudomonas sp. R1-18 TaxID=1632772 RepID=UPI003DA8A892